MNFKFTPEVLERVKSLFEMFQDKISVDEPSPNTLESIVIMTNIVLDAMQFTNLIPNQGDSESAEVDLQLWMITDMK